MPPFAIIPVLDLKLGHVVRARAGDRASYRPLVSPLAPTSRPVDVLGGLLALAPFGTVYVADLDAIGGLAPQETAIAELRRAAPHVEFWVDAGFTDAAAASQALGRGVVPVLGTESLASEAALAPALESVGPRRFVLSLDYRQGAFIGPPGVIQKVELWPDRIILMTLDRVGMTAGPDVAGLRSLVARAGARRVFAAGGVRGAEDIAALRARGVAGALVASALHDGRLTPATLDACLRDGD